MKLKSDRLGIELSSKQLQKYCDKKVFRRFNDMKESYKNPDNIKINPIIYNVNIIDLGVFEAGLTIINSGDINGEFYMTKGHKHKIPSKEIYILLSGKGKLVIVKGKRTKVFNLKGSKIYLIPKNAGHRLINTGNKKLEVLTIYLKNAGQDYNFKFNNKRFFKK